jgi:ATP/ADP translocase
MRSHIPFYLFTLTILTRSTLPRVSDISPETFPVTYMHFIRTLHTAGIVLSARRLSRDRYLMYIAESIIFYTFQYIFTHFTWKGIFRMFLTCQPTHEYPKLVVQHLV